MTEIDGKLCTIAKKEASLVWNCLLVGCWEKKHHYLIHCKNKDQKWCLFFSDQFFTLGKSQIEGKIGIFPWKICTGLEVMAWQQISVIGLLNSLLPHEKYTVWLLMADWCYQHPLYCTSRLQAHCVCWEQQIVSIFEPSHARLTFYLMVQVLQYNIVIVCVFAIRD